MEIPTTVEALDSSIATDPQGRAALLLVESLIHGLKARGALSVADAVEIIEVALDAQRALIDDAAQSDASMDQAASLLAAMLASMSIDLPTTER